MIKESLEIAAGAAGKSCTIYDDLDCLGSVAQNTLDRAHETLTRLSPILKPHNIDTGSAKEPDMSSVSPLAQRIDDIKKTVIAVRSALLEIDARLDL